MRRLGWTAAVFGAASLAFCGRAAAAVPDVDRFVCTIDGAPWLIEIDNLKASVAAQAEETYVCRDANAKLTFVTLDPAHKSVRAISGKAPGRCIGTFTDGTYGPVYTAPPGEYCVFNLFAEEKGHKFASFNGRMVTFGVSNETGTRKLTFDTGSGIMETPTDTEDRLGPKLAEVRHRQGRLLGRMESLGFKLREEATLQTLTEEVVKTSEIEGEILDKEQVRSSLARRLGMEAGALSTNDRSVDGIVEVILDATGKYDAPLTDERLFGWHAALFPTGWSGLHKIVVGAWREGPMEVVSGPEGRHRVHFEAPEAPRLEKEMSAFIKWYNRKDHGELDPVIKAAIAHFWFVTVHPFEDGNGRIARAIADMALARSEHSSQRFYSISAQIRRERNQYYDCLEETQKGDLDITPQLEWFLDCLNRAFDHAEQTLAGVLNKARFWEHLAGAALNDRQRLMLNRLLDGFEGKLTSSKWAKIAKCSQDTAARDIDDLVKRGVLQREAAGGRSTSYSLVINPEK